MSEIQATPKPPFAYFGGKTTHARRIAAELPAHGHYVEPYCGSLAVLLAKLRSGMETVNDLDRALVTFWRVLRERPADLARHCALTPHSLAEFRDAEDVDAPADDLELARRIWVRLTQGRGGTLCNTGWRHFVEPSGSNYGMPNYLDGYVARMAVASERLHHVSLECRPARDVIEWYGRSDDVLLYVDPPYLRSTRKSGAYRHEMTEADHRDLATALHQVKAAVVLSGYASDLYDLELYAGGGVASDRIPLRHRPECQVMGEPDRSPVVQPPVSARWPVRPGQPVRRGAHDVKHMKRSPWRRSSRFDAPAVSVADRHYNRQKPGSPQFVPPGRCTVLLATDRQFQRALWVTSWPYAQFVRHAWGGGLGEFLVP